MKITDEDRRKVARNLSAALPRNSRSVITDEDRKMVARNIWEEQRRSEEKAYQEKQRQMMSGYTSGKLELVSEEQTREYRMAARSYDATQQRQAQQKQQQQTWAGLSQAAQIWGTTAGHFAVGDKAELDAAASKAFDDHVQQREQQQQTWDAMSLDNLAAEYEQRKADYEGQRQSYIMQAMEAVDQDVKWWMTNDYIAGLRHRAGTKAGEEFDAQHAADRELYEELDAYRSNRQRTEEIEAARQGAQSYIDEWRTFSANKEAPENAAVRESMDSWSTREKANVILKGTSSEDFTFEEEREVVAYLLASDRVEEAIEYAGLLDKGMLNPRQQESIHNAAKAEAQRIANIENDFVRGLASLWQAIQGGADSVYSGFQNFGRMIVGDDDVRTGVQELANAYNIERVSGESWVGGALLQSVTATVQMTPAVVAGVLTGGAGTVAGVSVSSFASGSVLFQQSAGSSYAEAIRNGHSVGEAALYGILNGSMEVVTEKLMGGVKGVASKSAFGMKLGKTFAAASERLIRNPTAQKLFNIFATQLGQSVGEGFEESIQAIVEPILRDVIFNENSIAENGGLLSLVPEALSSAFIGGLTAWIMNGASGGVRGLLGRNGETLGGAMETDAKLAGEQNLDNKVESDIIKKGDGQNEKYSPHVQESPETSFKFSEMTEEDISKIAEQYRTRAPIKVPAHAQYTAKSKAKGYEQLSYKWRDGEYKYEVRWHTRTPNAPVEQGDTWVAYREKPGHGNISVYREFWINGKWIPGYQWFGAINAYQNGIATKEQTELLEQGHWKEQ